MLILDVAFNDPLNDLMLRYRLKTMILATAVIAVVISIGRVPSYRVQRFADFVSDGNINGVESMLSASIGDNDKVRAVVRHVCRYPNAIDLHSGERITYVRIQPPTIGQLLTARRSIVIGRDFNFQQAELIVTPFGIHKGRFWPSVLNPTVVVNP